MKSHNPRLERLKELLNLEERRVAVQQELETITERMSSLRDSLFDEGAAVTRPSTSKSQTETSSEREPKKRGGAAKRGKRGALKEQILGALSSAGSSGVRVQELSKALGVKPVNIHSWFHSSIKRYPQIKKLQGGHYRLEGQIAGQNGGAQEQSSSRSAASQPTERQAHSSSRKEGKAKGSKSSSRRGALSEQVLAELGKAGSKGISVRELATNIGANYRNIYIWFATTGKKNGKIKKIAPAQYKLAS
jgi:hypothetical protein